MDFEPNIITCPSCKTEFIHDKVNGLALTQLVAKIDARKKMYLRLLLNDLERSYKGTDLKEARKILFDQVNDYTRDIFTFLGYGLEAE